MTLARTDSSPSNLTYASSSSIDFSGEYDTTPGSSTSTVPGPGALTGKVVKALGVATLKGFERLVIARHWAAIVHTFPHTDEQALRIRHIDEIYNDLLEFSRPGMYSVDVNGKAIGLIMAQIGAGQTRQLIRTLTRWHPVELHILLSGILTQLAHLWNPSLRGLFSSPISCSYTQAQVPGRECPVLRLILFMSKIIRSSTQACRVVLDVGFLDVLLSLNHHFYFKDVGCKEEYHLYIACNASLLDITGYQEFRWFVARHPISSMWPTSRDKPKFFPFKIRRHALLLDPETDVALDDVSPFNGLSLDDICAQPCVSEMPPDELLKSLIFQVTHDQALRVYLARGSYSRKVTLLSKLFLSFSKSVKLGVGSLSDPLWRYQFSFSLHFIATVARNNPANRKVLLDAGAANYLVDSLRVIMPNAYSSAREIIQEHGFFGLVKVGAMSEPPMQQSLLFAITALFKNTV